jgi:hypothetical protein
MNTPPLTRYLQYRALQGPWRISGRAEGDFSGAVVIPSLAEYDNLFATLDSLAANPQGILSRFLIIVVVNHRENAGEEDRENNLRTIARLESSAREFSALRLAWADAASPGMALPEKWGGVGLARKIGLDLALTRLDHGSQSPLLVCLDADTLVEPTYLPSLTAHFLQSTKGGAVIPFRHRPAATPEGQAAIDRYELFLRSYVLGLSLAGSPYAFHTVGSAMACTAEAYVRMGGMNRRTAAEDFYFLQQLHRTSGVEQMHGTTVFPSPRPSHRVPFGTGRSVYRSINGERDAIMFYNQECFRILGEWLKSVQEDRHRSATDLMRRAASTSDCLEEFLFSCGFTSVWEKLVQNNSGPDALLSAFHGWFDALKTMKLIHHLSATRFPRCSPEAALPPLLAWASQQKGRNITDELAMIGRIQGTRG